MFFEHSNKVLMAMDALKKRQFGYERNIPKNALNRLYMRILTKTNVSRFRDWNTSIKDYYYDENAQVHFIEFLENVSLENILMESMIIAKVDKGMVRFTVNGISFSIDEDTVLDAIITECDIDLVDSCTYSDKINQLIALYNDEIKKKEKQKQFVHVLRLVKDKKSQ